MNKTMKMWMMAAILVFSVIGMVSCNNKNAKQAENEAQTETTTETEVVPTNTFDTVIDDYLVNEFGKQYTQGDVCIPYAFLVSTDDGNPDDILVWGDFWVFNYNMAGDTLKTVSGGNHPGLMHMKKTTNGYAVTAFDAVEDGTGNLESAQRIFGDKFDSYQEISSHQEKREDMRLKFTTDYLKEHGLSATMLQDYGWPAVALPK